MPRNRKCPNCGSENVLLNVADEENANGCLWFFLFGIVYIFWVLAKWTVGLIILCTYDWWMALAKSREQKGYVWKSERWFSGKRKSYFCQDCSHYFKS